MKLLVFFTVYLFSLPIYAAEVEKSLRSKVMELLPNDLQSLLLRPNISEFKKTQKDKIKRQEKDGLYLHYFENKNDVVVGLKNKKFDYLYVEMPRAIQGKEKSLFSEAYLSLSAKEKEDLTRAQNSGDHDTGRFITIKLIKQNIELVFSNTEERLIHSVLIRQMDGK